MDTTLYSIVVSIPACHAGDRGSIPRRGAMKLKPKNLTLSLPAIIIWNTKAREINDSIVFSIDYYSTLKETV